MLMLIKLLIVKNSRDNIANIPVDEDQPVPDPRDSSISKIKPGSIKHNATPYSEGVAGEHVYALQDIDTVFLSIPELVQHIPWITFKILFCFYLRLQTHGWFSYC